MSQQAAIRHKRGGLDFEDMIVGETTEHRYARHERHRGEVHGLADARA